MKKKTRTIFYSILFILLLLLSACGGPKADIGSEDGARLSDQDRLAGQVYKIVIDPGHGGDDPGATGASGRYEKDFTLSVSKKIVRLLEQEPKIQVFMTREDDRTLSTADRFRPNFANDLQADLYLSVHGNTFESPSVSGIETFYYHDESLSLAETVHAKLAAASGFEDRGVKREDYYVLKETNMPAILMELGYLTNPQEEETMWTDEFQESVASAIVEGIKEYLQIP